MTQTEKEAPPKLQKALVEDLPERMTDWFRSKLPGLDEISAEVKRPSDGYSGDTFIVNLESRIGDKIDSTKYVVRAQLGEATNPESDFGKMVGLLRVLGDIRDLSVPKLYWYEPDSTHINGPFFVMEYIEGTPVPDIPPFVVSGWFYDASPSRRRKVYESCIRFIADLHRIDWKSKKLEFLSHSGSADSPTRNHLRRLVNIYDKALSGNRPENASRIIEWLEANVPNESELVISWGDARPGNMLFSDGDCVAALDWEMCSLGDRALDLTWWINGDKYYLGDDIPRLDGMLERDEIVRIYESITGVTLENLRYFEVLSGFRFLAIHVHMMKLWESSGQSLFGAGQTPENFRTSRMLDKIFQDVVQGNS